MGKILKAIHPDDDAHYEKLSLRRGEIQLWEDGLRTEDKKGNYEWWYLDALFPDGSILVTDPSRWHQIRREFGSQRGGQLLHQGQV